MLGHVDHHRLGPESAHGLRHFHPDRPSTQDQQPTRNGLHRGHFAVGPDAVELAKTRDGRNDRVGAVREHHVLGRVAHPVDLDDARAGEPAGAAQQIDPPIGQPALLAGVGVVRDHEVTPGKRRLDVDLGARRRVARPVDRLARP